MVGATNRKQKDGNLEENLQEDLQPDLEENLQEDLEENLQEDLEEHLQQDLEENLQEDSQRNLEKDLQKQDLEILNKKLLKDGCVVLRTLVDDQTVSLSILFPANKRKLDKFLGKVNDICARLNISSK